MSVGKQLIAIHAFTCGLSIPFHCIVCLVLYQPQSNFAAIAVWYTLRSDTVIPPTLFFVEELIHTVCLLAGKCNPFTFKVVAEKQTHPH